MFPDAHEYVVLSKRRETVTTSMLTLLKRDGSVPTFLPGQCLTIYFPDLSQTLGKLYSISSAPCEKKLTITVKAIGRFSNRLCSLQKGDVLLASLPHGDFYPHSRNNVVLLAGGMGITPFRSLVVETAMCKTVGRVALFYSAKSSTDMPFSDELYTISRSSPTLTVNRFVTQETKPILNIKQRRVRADDILSKLDEPREFLISGSLSFVLGLKNMLIEHGIERSSIQTESYF